MRTDEALAYLASLAPSTIRLGLERVRAALARLGHPERSFPSIHVAGTNGKGSTCAMLASCLRQRYRVGFYSSPHLVRVNERFKINGVDISDPVLAQRIVELREALGDGHELTYFEFGTVLAFWHFAREGVEVAVIETGLGGRLDATSTCEPIVTAITSIGFDHEEFLGSTLPAIAGEKAGIVKAGVPLVVARQPPEVLAVLQQVAPSLVLEGRDVVLERGTFRGKRTIEGLHLSLGGAHQSVNAAVALGCLECISTRFPLDDHEIRRGLSTTRWPGRMQELSGEPTIVLDGAHNPAGVDVLIRGLDTLYRDRSLHLVFGVFADKAVEPMMQALLPRMRSVHLAPLASPRSRPPHSYAPAARALCPDISVCGSVEAALREACHRSEAGSLVVVAGSLHLVGEVLEVMERDLRQFLTTLAHFEPGDDPAETMRTLSEAVRSIRTELDPAGFRQAVFAMLERFPDAEFGTPGALVHQIERLGDFEADLLASLERQPTFLTVSMVNRAMNLTETLDPWRHALRGVIAHARTPDWVRTAAERYLEHHRGR